MEGGFKFEEEEFLACCGSSKFAKEMIMASPSFTSLGDAVVAARDIWFNKVDVTGWLQAFAAHPQIGNTPSSTHATFAQWSKREQATALATATGSSLQDPLQAKGLGDLYQKTLGDLKKGSQLASSFSSMRVIIGSRGNKFALEVGLKEAVIDIKKKIEQLLGVPIASQSLAVCGLELLDGLDMDDYPIVTEGTKINLTIKYWMAPNFYHSGKVQVIIKFSARQLHMEVDRTETVRSLKEKIHIMDGTPIRRMSLFFCGTELDEDFRHLSEYSIHEFSEIVVFLKSMSRGAKDEPPSQRLSLVVQTSSSLLNSARIPVEMKDSSTVNELKELLLGGNILPADDYLFIHKQRIMRDNCSLKWHGVGDGDFLYVFKGTICRT